jgi:hypothetical protein
MRGLLAVLALAGCGGPPIGQCDGIEDCDEGQSCNPPDYQGFCTSTTTEDPPCDARGEACVGDDGGPGICWYVQEVCGFEHRCKPACTVGDDSTCGAGRVNEICRDDGQCTAASCIDGELTCPADSSCVDVGGDVNGCVHATCSGAEDCGEDQHCVVGRCFLEFGECQSSLL